MPIDLNTVPPQTSTHYPKPFKAVVSGRVRRRVGDAAALTNFGVNWVTLAPGSASALRHWHTTQDEFIYVVSGTLMLVTDDGETVLMPGMMAGFPAGVANGHHLVNRSDQPAVYLEVGDRAPNDQVSYPDVDLQGSHTAVGWQFTHRDGRPYDAP